MLACVRACVCACVGLWRCPCYLDGITGIFNSPTRPPLAEEDGDDGDGDGNLKDEEVGEATGPSQRWQLTMQQLQLALERTHRESFKSLRRIRRALQRDVESLMQASSHDELYMKVWHLFEDLRAFLVRYFQKCSRKEPPVALVLLVTDAKRMYLEQLSFFRVCSDICKMQRMPSSNHLIS